MPATTVKNTKMGRPTLKDEDKARVFGELSLLTPKTPEYREKRRELAMAFSYTERAIDYLFERLKAAFLAKENGRRSDNPTAQHVPTSPEGSASPIMPDVPEGSSVSA